MLETLITNTQQPIDRLLRRELTRLGWLGTTGIAGGCFLLGITWFWQGALQWFVQAELVWIFLCYQTMQRLPLNRQTPKEPLYKDLGWANRVTLLRAWLIAAVAY